LKPSGLAHNDHTMFRLVYTKGGSVENFDRLKIKLSKMGEPAVVPTFTIFQGGEREAKRIE